MELRRRFIFRGNAAAIGGRIVRPTDVVIDSSTASSLTVAGGRSRSKAGATRFGEFVSFGAASTSAEGLFDDVKQQIELSFGRVAEDALTMSTDVHTDVTSLSVGDKPKLTIKHLHAALNSKSPAASGEPAIAVGNETTIEGAAIDGFGLVGRIVEIVVVGFRLGPVDALVRDVVEGLEMLIPVLAGDEAFLDVALDRTAVVEARGLRVLVTSHGAFS